jgi:adenylosuccinate synthase
VLFEGAQGAMLDIDLGTYPFVTSSNTTVGGAASGSGLGPAAIDYVLGIVKAYTTRVGAGPFPTELLDDMGRHLGRVGNEFGSTTGRPRRCGWFDAVMLKRAVFTNSIAGLCLTKLDVLDGIPEIKICVGYRLDGRVLDTPPLLMDRFGECEPVYETVPGWSAPTSGVTSYAALPAEAKAYLRRIEEIAGAPVDIISTGPSREAVIIRRHPFD